MIPKRHIHFTQMSRNGCVLSSPARLRHSFSRSAPMKTSARPLQILKTLFWMETVYNQGPQNPLSHQMPVQRLPRKAQSWESRRSSLNNRYTHNKLYSPESSQSTNCWKNLRKQRWIVMQNYPEKQVIKNPKGDFPYRGHFKNTQYL